MADYVKLRTHIVTHERFLEAGAAARDLYVWGMLYAGQLETDGAIPMVALLASPWGAGGKSNIKLAQRLVDVGLWERTDKGFVVLRWTEQGNATKAELQAAREAARERMRRRRSPEARSPDVRANFERTHDELPVGEVPSFTSTCIGSGSREGVQGERPAWFDDAVATVEMNTGQKIDVGKAWLRYEGHRTKERKPMSAADARYWLVTVDVREAERDQAEARRRDAADRSRREGPPQAPKPSPEQARKFNADLAAAITAAAGKKGAA